MGSHPQPPPKLAVVGEHAGVLAWPFGALGRKIQIQLKYTWKVGNPTKAHCLGVLFCSAPF